MEEKHEDIDQKEKAQEEKQKKKDILQDKKIEEHKEDVKEGFKSFSKSTKNFFSELLNISHDTDKEATTEAIKKGIYIKGHAAWILVFSILIASIGLNISSAAVVIGAMLISPLMGPILGIGFSVGINDVDTLRKSLINLGVMVALSIITSFLFFSIPIFEEATPEIIARTRPDVRDVLIAISGGLALIIAISRPRPEFNTVAGVAIATALMPPLCTAGYGLATKNLEYFGGAMFLFFINSTFIGLAAFAITKYLRFPMVKYINQTKRKRISNLAYGVGGIILLFSIYLFYQLYIENKYKSKVEKFVTNVKDEGVHIIGNDSDILDYENKEIKLYVFGNGYNEKDKSRWQNELKELGLGDTKLTVLQSQDDSGVRNDIDQIKDLYFKNYKLLSSKEETIREKNIRIKELEYTLRKYYDNDVPFNQITKEIEINYGGIDKISFAKEYVTNFKKIDTIPVVSVKWNSKLSKEQINRENTKLKKWLEARLRIKNIELRPLN